MDVVTNVRKCLATWNKGGEQECATTLSAAHCNISDPACLHFLTTAYHTILSAVLSVWSPEHPLSAHAFVDFVRGVLAGLPSSSSGTSATSIHVNVFGEHLIDIIWTIDTQLDEFLNDARQQIAAVGEADSGASANAASFLAKAKKVKMNAENDKAKVQTIVKLLVEYNIVSLTSCRERLDSTILANVGLIPDKAFLDKKEIRTRTGIFYKQNKFNLLREQSEGYSKLITEITSSMGPPHSTQTGLPADPLNVIESRARPVWEKVISLIGYFDLDPNRALDVILDVFSVHLTTHYTFFLALLSFSPWASTDRRSANTKEETMEVDAATSPYKGKTLDEILEISEPRSSIPGSGGSRVLAQVLGFKFAHYQALATEPTPRNLFLMCALLIRDGFISLEDIFPHLAPNDEEMENERKEYLASVQSKISGAKTSALAMAAPLESSLPSQSKAKQQTPAAEAKPVIVKDTNQKVSLVTALLALGALRPAIATLSKYPWLVDAHPEIADLLIRILKFSTAPLYDSVMASSKENKERNASFSQPRARYGASGVIRPAPRKPVLTTWAPVPPSTSSTDFVFFFPNWSDRVPVTRSFLDVEVIIEPILRFIGPHLSRDPLFVTKFLRIGRHHLATTVPLDPETKKPVGEPDPEDPVRLFWLKIVRLYMLPALPLIRGNTICTVEVWNILRSYKMTTRWKLYGEWKNSVYKSHPELRVREVQADRESKGILRRLSHNTIDSLSGAVGKLAHNNPCIFFTHAVNQVMAYDNLGSVVVPALKFVTIMGFDVLVFVILDAFSNPNKARVKDDGVNIADWLQSLASFTGMLFRRFSTDLTPVLTYIVHQLLNDKTSEIVVLRELIWKMAGIEPLPELSENQIVAMGGGPILKIQALAATTRGAGFDPADLTLKGPQRLSKALLESGLAFPLLVQVAQQRESCVFKASEAPLKSLAGLYDTTHGVLLQYLDLLTSPGIMSLDDYATKILPPLREMGEQYGISAPICMQIIRPVLQQKLLKRALAMDEQQRIANQEAEKRLKAALTAKREPGTSASRVASPAVGHAADTVAPKSTNGQEVTTDENAMEVDSGAPQGSQQPQESPWLPELEELFDDVKSISPGNVSEVVGPGFFLTFWQLSTYDLFSDQIQAQYNEQDASLDRLSREEASKYNIADRSTDRTKRATASVHRLRRDRYNNFRDMLVQELKEQVISRGFTDKRIAREKNFWFAHSTKSVVLINSLIEHCIQPRALLSPMDADFCAQFIKVLHVQGTPGFHTLMCYDKLLGDNVKVVIFSCTEHEARNYGRFLAGVLTDLHKWHADKQLFEQENRSKDKKDKATGKYLPLPGLNNSSNGGKVLNWMSFQSVHRKWHKKLARNFTECIQTGEFMHVYNAIIVLNQLESVFPFADITVGAADLDAALDRFLETEARPDLTNLARSYSALLKKREAQWKQPAKANGATSVSTTSSPAPEKSRANGVTQQSISSGRTASQQPPASAPSGPRAQQGQNAPQSIQPTHSDPVQSTKLSMESIPRPEVVKRVRPDAKTAEASRPAADTVKTDGLPPPIRPIPVHISGDNHQVPARTPDSYSSRYPSRNSQAPSPIPVASGRDSIDNRRNDDRIGSSGGGASARMEGVQDMPPPAIPSQSQQSVQGLRETARMSIHPRAHDKLDVKTTNGSNAPSPRVRSQSPNSGSRPGTRNASADSRESGGRMRADRIERERGEPGTEDRERKEPSSRESGGGTGRRDSLTHTRERANRDRGSERDSRDDRGRDRHGDRERERDRDRDRERDRERDRDRDRDSRDRHRRDDKDRDRDRDSRKERDNGPNRGAVPSLPAVEGLPSRPEPSRHRGLPSAPSADDGLGKRRRAGDDDSDRASKRSSRKDGHRDSERGRRPQEKDAHDRNRDSDRRRKDREGESEPKDSRSGNGGPPPEKAPEKRTPGPSGPQQMEAPKVPPPIAPRSMLDTGRERERIAARKAAASAPLPAPAVSLRSRIGEKEPPGAPSAYRHDASRSEDDKDAGRKRTASEREKDLDPPAEPPSQQPPKRPKINRNRYTGAASGQSHAVARKLLPIDPHAADKSGRRHAD
ncbi:hypothetical protein FA15DRAFT_664153 [Coprinopsis marcescibilis]|uniref:THO complex subunit 2 n=1 Tax=Coprinopsis marcescibilis TaxID=230819 RepID=A0A5C3LB36_COPMA|nr:hypothetical protein FA15DRAFT_664153 [Coprinopsis marcescibilis]